MKVRVIETSGATFTSYTPYVCEAHELSFLSSADMQKLTRGETVVVYHYNRVGTTTKRNITPIK